MNGAPDGPYGCATTGPRVSRRRNRLGFEDRPRFRLGRRLLRTALRTSMELTPITTAGASPSHEKRLIHASATTPSE